MASPFSVFRKHRTVLLAGLTILAMFGFVVLPNLLESMGARGAVDSVVVTTAKYGKITQNQLGRMIGQHQRMQSILVSTLVSIGADPNQAANLVNGMFGDATEESVVHGWLQARRAEQLGLVISNEAIKSFLRDFTRNSLKSEDLHKILQQQHFSDYQFFQAFRDELLAMRLREIFQSSLAGTPPAQRWDYYTRLKRKATAEVVPVAVERIVSQQSAGKLSDPDEATLRKFFDEHKDKIKLPDSPEPGFREPQKVDVRYFKADLEKFMAAVTDEEIKQEYEKNKEAYDKQEAAELKQSGNQPPVGEKPPVATPTGEKPAAERPTAEEPSAQEPSAEKPAIEKPSAEKASTEKASADKPAGRSGADKDESDASQKPSPQEGPASKSPPPGDGSATRGVSRFRLTAFAQDKQDQAGEEKAEKSQAGAAKAADSGSAEPKSEEPQTASEVLKNPPAAEAKEPASEAKKPTPGPPQRPDESKQGATGKEGEKLSAVAAPSAGTSAGTTAEKEQKPEERPSARIKDQIRSRLATEKIAKIYQHLQTTMREYGRKWRLEKADEKTKKQNVTSSPAPDFAALATQNDLALGETGLVPAIQMMGTEIGGSYVDFRSPLVEKVFSTSLLLYRPETSFDLRGNRYLFWKVEETKEYTPQFDEEGVRQRVLHAWKMVQARSLAKQEAERLAAEARKAEQPLADVFRNQPNTPVTSTAPFSWLTYGNLPMLGSQTRPELSKVNGVESPGPDFMRTVFDLQPGGVGVAMNQPQTVAYVVRVVELAPSDDVLWQQFEVDPYEKYAAVSYTDQLKTMQAWLDELKAAAGLQWERKPERQAETAEMPDE